MKSFSSIKAFVKHYEFKNSIPTEVRIALDGKERRYVRGSRTQYVIEKGPFDSYEYNDYDDLTGKLPKLKVHFIRYFEMKKIVEAYFLLGDKDGQEFLSPIYFNENFITADNFKQFPNDVKIEQFNLKWVNLNKMPSAFQEERTIAYKETIKGLFYEFEAFKHEIQEKMYIDSKLYLRRKSWEEKWSIDFFTGKSPYFNEVVKPDDLW